MIVCDYDEELDTAQIVLRPNRSWTWQANVYLVFSLMLISLTIGSVLTYQGYWLVLPFTVLEMCILLGCLYYCVRRTHITEVLTFSQHELVFERGVNKPTQRFALERYFARFFVKPARHPWYDKTLALRCRGLELEVGNFLILEEKDDLIRHLRQVIHRLEVSAAQHTSASSRSD